MYAIEWIALHLSKSINANVTKWMIAIQLIVVYSFEWKWNSIEGNVEMYEIEWLNQLMELNMAFDRVQQHSGLSSFNEKSMVGI